jgi:hypothetical protein
MKERERERERESLLKSKETHVNTAISYLNCRYTVLYIVTQNCDDKQVVPFPDISVGNTLRSSVFCFKS